MFSSKIFNELFENKQYCYQICIYTLQQQEGRYEVGFAETQALGKFHPLIKNNFYSGKNNSISFNGLSEKHFTSY